VFGYILLIFYNFIQHNGDVSPESYITCSFIILPLRTRAMKWSLAGHVYPLDKITESYKTLISKPGRNRAFTNYSLERKNNINMYCEDGGCETVTCICLGQDWVR
jgi:hypothetical protein